jgi:hypothetical protein
MLFGVLFMVASIRRARPHSEVGSLSGSSRGMLRLMGFATGLWLVATSVEAFGHDLHALLVTFEAYFGLYVVLTLAALAGSRAGRAGRAGQAGIAHNRALGLGRQEPDPRLPYWHHR